MVERSCPTFTHCPLVTVFMNCFYWGKYNFLRHAIANRRMLAMCESQPGQRYLADIYKYYNILFRALSSRSSSSSDATPTPRFKSGAHHSQLRKDHAHLPLWLHRVRSRTSSYGPPFYVGPTLPKREKTISSPLRKIRPSQPNLRDRPHSPKAQVNITGERSCRE